MDANRKSVPVNEKDRVINFLPFSHVFERGWACLSLAGGCRIDCKHLSKGDSAEYA